MTVWVYEGTLKLEYQAVTLSKYRVELLDDRKHIKGVSNPRVAETIFRSPQVTLFDLGPDEWLLYWKAPSYAPRQKRRPGSKVAQLVLFEVPVQEKAAGQKPRLPSCAWWLRPERLSRSEVWHYVFSVTLFLALGEDRLPLIAGVIQQHPDVVALLEARSRSNAEALAHQLGMHLTDREKRATETWTMSSG